MWDSGAINNTVFYRKLLQFTEDEPGVVYHTANTPPANRTLTVGSKSFTFPANNWVQFSVGDTVMLDSNASFTIVHADGNTLSDLNENSIVVRVDLGGHSVLLTGDVGSGDRENPSEALGAVEAELVLNQAALIDVDILQVGHHGSMTSSRADFIDAVSPTYALISSGPKKYGSVILPDDEVVDMLMTKGIVILRTDLNDKNCPVNDKVGRSSQHGECTNYVMEW